MADKTINLVLGVHNHQPFGNFDHVIEHACERCYLPFLQVLEAHPQIKMSAHFTGFLLEWIAGRYPEIINCMKRLVARGQIELVTGGYYEPILAAIPDADKKGQIEKLTQYLNDLFNSKGTACPIEGMWLAERVWEPHLPACLSASGVKYVCLDDSHFKSVGMGDHELFRSYITEEQGQALEVFPINQKLRYIMPFDEPPAVIEYLRSLATEGGEQGAFYFDDGEKFGIWPGTYDTVYTHKWLERLFQAIEANLDWIKPHTFGSYRKQIGPAGRVYLPAASYMEMLEWSLPPEKAILLNQARHNVEPQYASFLRGGFWRFFMVKYAEVNNLHKKMLQVSKQLEARSGKDDKLVLDAVRDKLWSAQSNDPYWHGVFGGLYLTNLRTANYQALIAAEAELDALEHAGGNGQWLETIQADLDLDGQLEIAVKTPECNYFIAPAYGGALYELDYKPRPFNVIDTLQRRFESYHVKLKQASTGGEPGQVRTIHEALMTKESHLDKYLAYDWHRRLCFLDHFLDPATTLPDMSRAQYGEKGDFVNQAYIVESILDKEAPITIKLSRHGHVWTGTNRAPVTIEKTYLIDSAGQPAEVSYKITNASDAGVELWFAPEFNFNFLAADASDRYYFNPESGKHLVSASLSSSESVPGIKAIGIGDQWSGIKLILDWSKAATLWRFPIYTVSNSEAGFERLYQGSCLLPHWQIKLGARESWTVVFHLGLFSCER